MTRTRLLVIDDEVDLQIGINALLRNTKYDCIFAQDALSAIATANRERPDVILLDIGLPAGDGFVVLERLKRNAHLAHIPVVVLTARTAEEAKERMMKAGATEFLEKPADRDDIIAALDRAVGAR